MFRRHEEPLIDSEIEGLVGWMSRVFKPRPPDKDLLDVILLTWDTEYKLPFLFPRPEDYERKFERPYPKHAERVFQSDAPFITHQLAAQLPDGSIVTERLKIDRPMTAKEFRNWVEDCMNKWGIVWHGRRTLVATHSSRMELQHISPLPRIRELGSNSWEARIGPDVTIIDSYKMLGTSLEKATKGTPFPKYSLEGYKGKPQNYWRANPDLLFKEDPEKFWSYALGDVKALLWTLLHLRDLVWKAWHVDILRTRSLAGLSCRIFATSITEALEPAVREKYLDGHGRPRTRLIFDPELVEARRCSLKAYHGGRRESYVMGRVDGTVYCYDFSKQYTTATCSIPLPTQSTKIVRMSSLRDCQEMVGFARVKFEFPKGILPSLGVKDPRFPKLIFPREGTCWTGVFSIRRAIEKGATVEFVDGWGFLPTEKETSHPLHRYFRMLLELGKQNEGTFLETYAKNLANMLVGRLIGKYDYSNENEDSYEEMLARGWRPRPKQVMSSFAPIVASLILDQARALEDRLISLTRHPVYSHTDSVFSEDPIDLSDPFFETVRKYGGEVKLELVADAGGWTLRAAVAYFRSKDQSKKPKAAHHAIKAQREDFITVIETMLENPGLKPDGFCKTEYTTLREHRMKGWPIASYRINLSKPKYEWDRKRKLLGPALSGQSLWTERRETEPWGSVDEILDATEKSGHKLAARFRLLTGRRGRPSKVGDIEREKILSLRSDGSAVADIARVLGLSNWSVYRVLRKSHLGASPK